MPIKRRCRTEMGRIPQDTIERIRDSADIVDVVSQYVDLKKRGRNFFGICPFHSEKTPSFSVAPEKNIYHCFGCGVGGSPINFLMEYEKINFVEAVRKLGERYGIPVEMEQDGSSREFFTQLYELQQLAAESYQRTLFAKAGQPALDYLTDRGLTKTVLKEFQVGFAPDSWDYLAKIAEKKEFSTEALDKSGLFGTSEKGRFDRFRSRIMFPIANSAGKIVAFGGRVFDSDDPAKYMNSPETPLYQKSDILYGLNVSRNHIRQAESAVLVEGYMDFLTLYQAGITNLVAVSGTAMTDRHAALIRRVARRVNLAYDGDEAGTKAALRSGYTLYRNGVEPRVIAVPADSDPDDWVRSAGAEVFKKAVREARELIDYQLTVQGADDLRGVQRSEYIGELLGEIATIDDGILRGELLRMIGQRLGIEYDDLLRVLQKKIRPSRRVFDPPVEQKEVLEYSSRLQKAQVEIVRTLADGHKGALKFAREHMDLNVFTEPLLKRLARDLLAGKLKAAAIVEGIEAKAEREAATKILFDDREPIDENPVRLLRECLISIRGDGLRQRIKAARLAIREQETAGADATELTREYISLKKEYDQLDQVYPRED